MIFGATGVPRELAVGPDGNVWFTSYQGMGRITLNGVVTEFSVAGTPQAIVTSADRELWFISNDITCSLVPQARSGA
jgi:streptogramin lyase